MYLKLSKMPKISNKDIYNQDDTLSMNDYTIGSNSNTGNKKTQTYTFASIFSLFYNFLGYNAFLNTTDTTTYPIGTPGCFYVFDENDALTTDFSEARKITFSSYDTYNFDTANYFNIIVSSGKFLFKLINLEDKNNFVFLNPSNFVLSGTGTTFNVDVLAEAGLSNGSFVNYKRYLLVLEFAAGTFNPADYDLTDFTNTSGNPFITAQDLTDALSLLPAPITNHSGLSLDDGTNPHGTTKGDVGLGNVPNVDTSTTSNISEGSNLYFTTARVLATVLSGLSLATGGAIVSTDTILVAFGKLQKQIDDLTTSIGNKLDKVTTVDVEKVYIKNADGTQGMKATSDFGGAKTESVTISNRWTLTTANVYYRSRGDFGGFNVDTLNVSTAVSVINTNVASTSSALYCTKVSKSLSKIYVDGSNVASTLTDFKLGVFAFQRSNTTTPSTSAINIITIGEFVLTKASGDGSHFWEITPDNLEIPAGYLVSCVLMRTGGTGTEMNCSMTFKFDDYVA